MHPGHKDPASRYSRKPIVLVVLLVFGVGGEPQKGRSIQARFRKGGTSVRLVHRLTYNDDVAAGQLAVFQGASDEHI